MDKEHYAICPSWEGGPLREFATTQINKGFKPWFDPKHPERAFSRNYVCSSCRLSLTGICEVKVQGVVERKWLCTQCRDVQRPKEAQPKHLRRKAISE